MSHDEPFEKDLLHLFHNLIYHGPRTHFAEPVWAPPADLVVDDTSARVILELAGVPRENVRVGLPRDNLLVVSGRRTPPHDVQGADYHRAEIRFGDFQRVIELPWAADRQQVRAAFHDGMLEIHLVPAPQTRRVEITIQHHTP